MQISLANGETREVTKEFISGEYICPWCEYPAKDKCTNPGCLTRFTDIESLQAALNEIEEKRKAIEARSYSAYLWGQSLRRGK